MKQIVFRLSEDFRLDTVTYAKMYELENHSTEILIKTSSVMDGFVYQLHKEQNGVKTLVLLDKTFDGLSYVVNNGFLAKAGNACLQVRAVSENVAIESNIVDFRIGRFINAESEPTPEEISIVERLMVETEALKASKQNKLIAGENITIEGNVISSTGGGGSGDITKKYVDEQNALQDATIENHETRIEELESKPSGSGVSDVQIDGASIVSDGIANIPIATTASVGLVKGGGGQGVSSISTNGNIVLNWAYNSQIDSRHGTTVLRPLNLDYAVKQAMCDGKGAEWTDVEKQKAQERIGILSSEGVTF